MRSKLCVLLLCLFSYGAGAEVDQKTKDLVELLESKVVEGHAGAEYYLGNILLYGLYDWPANKSRGIELLTRAAEAGIANAQYNLAASYKIGNGVPQNQETATRWYKLAAERGHIEAHTQLGIADLQNKNFRSAKTYFEFAAIRGDVDAQVMLGMMYSLGEGMPEDSFNAYVWLSIATAYGDTEAQSFRDGEAAKLSADSLRDAQKMASTIFEEIEANKEKAKAR